MQSKPPPALKAMLKDAAEIRRATRRIWESGKVISKERTHKKVRYQQISTVLAEIPLGVWRSSKEIQIMFNEIHDDPIAMSVLETQLKKRVQNKELYTKKVNAGKTRRRLFKHAAKTT